jgi:hypothetical protein
VELKEGENYKYPRIEFLMENCIRIIEGKEVIEEGQKQGQGKPGQGGKPAAAKKPAVPAPATKPGAKPGKPGAGKGQEEEVKEKSALEKEMEHCLELEKQGAAYRIMQIYTYAQNVVKDLREKFLDLYEKLNVWTEYSFKIDCDLMDEMVYLG